MPEYLFKGDHCPDLFFVDYKASKESTKNKIVFSRNMINLIGSGKKGIYSHDKHVEIDKTRALFVAKGQCLTTEKLDEDGQFRSLILFFDNKNVLDFKIKYEELISKHAETGKEDAPLPCFIFEQDDFIRNYAASIRYMLNTSKQVSNELCQLKFEEILIHLFNQYGRSFYPYFHQLSTNETMDIFKKTVEQNALNKLSLDEMAFLCNMSLSSFKRHFLKTYQQAPQKWFQQKRLEHAFQLIKHSKAKPGDIYFEVGYESLSSFTTAFKQQFGVAPTKIEVLI